MPSYRSDTAALARLETFSTDAFTPDAAFPASVCGFVLALAVIYDDLKDIAQADHLLASEAPASPDEYTRERGQLAGIQAHIRRHLAATIYELLRLVEGNLGILSEPAFAVTARNLPKDIRAEWESIAAVAENREAKGSLAEALHFVRDKVGFHYDRKELLRGYQIHFSEDPARPAFISRGDSLQSSRFYFADAAAQAYFRVQLAVHDPSEYFSWGSPLVRAVNRALHELVIAFIQRRSAFRDYRPHI
jgi:hypothetical protein